MIEKLKFMVEWGWGWVGTSVFSENTVIVQIRFLFLFFFFFFHQNILWCKNNKKCLLSTKNLCRKVIDDNYGIIFWAQLLETNDVVS